MSDSVPSAHYMTRPGTPQQAISGALLHDRTRKAGWLNPAEKLLIEKTLLQMYPRLQRQNLWPAKWLNAPLLPEALIQATPPSLRRIVEIGCGDGLLSNTLALLFPHIEIIGIDSDPLRIETARATVGYRTNLKFICANAAILAEIPCDRIIYNDCLSQLQSAYAFKKLLLKTSRWLVAEGDLIVKESFLKLLSQWQVMQDLMPTLRDTKSLVESIRILLNDVGYAHPQLYQTHIPAGVPRDFFYRVPRTPTPSVTQTPAIISNTTAGPNAANPWQEWMNHSNDSLLGFLFSDNSADFRKELV